MPTTLDPLTQAQEEYIARIDIMHEYPTQNTPHEIDKSNIYLNHLILEKVEIFTLGKPQDWKNDYRSNCEFLKLLRENEVEKLYIPTANTFTGRVCLSNAFENEFHTHGIKIMTGCEADGFDVPSGSAVLIPTADCPTIVYHDISNDFVVVAHAGLGSVVDLQKIMTGEHSRLYDGVVDEIVKHTERSKDFNILILCGISHESFVYSPDDPIYGKKNKRLLHYLMAVYGEGVVPSGSDHGGISIPELIEEKFRQHGISSSRIYTDKTDTYSNEDFWSHSRYVKNDLGYCGRNAVLVLHKK